MKKLILPVLFLLCASAAQAQTSTITAAMGASYDNGTLLFSWKGDGGQIKNVGTFFDSAGNLSIDLPQGRNVVITFCQTTGTPCFTFSYLVGASGSATTQFTAATTGGGGGTPGGTNGNVQYNNSGAFGGLTPTSGGVLSATSSTVPVYSSLLAANAPVLGGGAGVVPFTTTGITTDGTSVLSLGRNGGAGGGINLLGSTSGTGAITTSATGTTLNFAGSGGIAATAGPLVSGLPAGGVGSSMFLQQEGTVPTGLSTATQDNCYADSTQHGILCNFNAGTTRPLVQGPTSATSGHLATFSGTNGGLLTDGGAVPTGTVTSIATTSPITGGTITTNGTIACATCVVASSPGAGIAHFAGSTQTVTSSAVVNADITSMSLDKVTGAAAQATGTEVGAGDEYTFAGVETANLTHPFSFTDANSTNNNTNGAVIIGTTGTSTGAVPLRVNQGATAGNFVEFYNAGTVTNGVLSGGTLKAAVNNVGAFVPSGTTAFFTAYTQGTTSGAVAPCSNANTACFQAPTAVTAYVADVPGSAPVNNNSAMIFSNASPSIGSFAKIPQNVQLTSQYTNSTTGFTNVTGGSSLAFSVEANTNYVGMCTLYYQAASTGGLNIEFTGPASPTNIVYSLVDVGSSTTIVNSSVATAYSTSLGAAVTTATTNFPALVHFALQNGANAGTLQMLAKSSAAAQLQIQIGSYCIIQ